MCVGGGKTSAYKLTAYQIHMCGNTCHLPGGVSEETSTQILFILYNQSDPVNVLHDAQLSLTLHSDINHIYAPILNAMRHAT